MKGEYFFLPTGGFLIFQQISCGSKLFLKKKQKKHIEKSLMFQKISYGPNELIPL